MFSYLKLLKLAIKEQRQRKGNFLLQDKCNNIIEKSCGCKACCFNKKNLKKRNEQFFERNCEETTC